MLLYIDYTIIMRATGWAKMKKDRVLKYAGRLKSN